jgi:glycosyltransferase involved in cell wall biosynthesis
MSPSPQISIIMPAFNAEAFIARSIQSVLKQTRHDWELIVLDDGSTDHTALVVQQFNDPRIRLIQLSHIGIISTIRNRGLQEADGAFIAFLDADDLYEPNTLEILADYLERQPEATAVHGYFRWINDQDELIEVGLPVTLPRFVPQYSWADILGAKIPTWLQGLMFRREVLSRIKPFNETILINEDYLFFLELFLDKFDGVHSIPSYVFRYRHYPDSITKTPENFKRILKNQSVFFEYLFNHPKLEPMLAETGISLIATRFIHTIALIRLRFGQPKNARIACLWALKAKNISKKDWILQLSPILLLSIIPAAILERGIKSFKSLNTRFKKNKPNLYKPLISTSS